MNEERIVKQTIKIELYTNGGIDVDIDGIGGVFNLLDGYGMLEWAKDKMRESPKNEENSRGK